jgi:hypothetical protein
MELLRTWACKSLIGKLKQNITVPLRAPVATPKIPKRSIDFFISSKKRYFVAILNYEEI